MGPRSAHLTDADQADPAVIGYLDATEEIRSLEKALAKARAGADAYVAAVDTQTGDARGRLVRLAAHLGVKEQSLKNQRQRGKRGSAG
jgi:hypothetical protein